MQNFESPPTYVAIRQKRNRKMFVRPPVIMIHWTDFDDTQRKMIEIILIRRFNFEGGKDRSGGSKVIIEVFFLQIRNTNTKNLYSVLR